MQVNQRHESVAQTGNPGRARVLEDVKKIVGEKMGVAVEAIREATELERDLGCDSLDRVEILMEVEDHFGIDVPEDLGDSVRSIRDIVDGILRLTEAAGLG